MTLTGNPSVGLWSFRNHAIDTQNVSNACCADGTISISTAATYPTADLAIYVPIRIRRSGVVTGFAYSVGSSSGNIDIGLYNAAGTRLVSSGATAMAGSNTETVVDVTDTTVSPGLHYIAITCDNTTGTLYRDTNAAPWCAAAGVVTQQLGAGGTLPSTATWAVNQTLAFYPLLAVFFNTVVT